MTHLQLIGSSHLNGLREMSSSSILLAELSEKQSKKFGKQKIEL